MINQGQSKNLSMFTGSVFNHNSTEYFSINNKLHYYIICYFNAAPQKEARDMTNTEKQYEVPQIVLDCPCLYENVVVVFLATIKTYVVTSRC